MAFSALKFKNMFSKAAYVHANTPKQFLELSETCKEQAQKMTTPSVLSTSPKVNFELCKYLADQLKLAVRSAHSFLLNRGLLSAEETADYLDVFKLLHALANVVENFIRNFCHDAWIRAAVLMPNVSDYVLSVSFDLELLTHFFCGSLALTKVDDVYKAEVATVRKKASEDRETLLREANAFLRTKEKTSKEYQLAVLLLGRIETSRQNSVGSLSGAYRTDMGSLKEMEQLGKGSFGTVYRATWLAVEVAKKTFYAPSSPEFEREVSILGGLSHPNVASLLCYGGDERECFMVMELMDGDLFGVMQKIMAEDKTLVYPFSILEAVNIMFQVGTGMEYLHDMRIVHRDLKAMNILVRAVKARGLEGRTKYFLAKLADFGLSKTKERTMTYSNQTLNTGTTRWMAPELIKSNTSESQGQVLKDTMLAKYPFGSDVYSFAMVCYEILTGKMPYFEVTSPSEVKKKVLMGERPKLPSHCPWNLKYLIERCWNHDASRRPRFGEICGELRHLKCLLLMPYSLQVFGQVSTNGSPSTEVSKIQEAESIDLQYDVSKPSPSTSGFNPVLEGASDTVSHVHEILEDPGAMAEVSTGSQIVEILEEPGATAEVSIGSQIVVGLALGNTFSGYAFAHKSKPEEIHMFYAWPRLLWPSSKALTAIYYEAGDASTARVKSWGSRAIYDYSSDMDDPHLQEMSAVNLPVVGTYFDGFMVHLASKDAGESSAAKNPKGFTVTQVVSDYLREVGSSIMPYIRAKVNDDQLTMGNVQWCVTVPSIWDDHARKQMEVCMADAGLIRSANSPFGSPHPLSIVLVPEAASRYCHRSMPDLELKVGDRVMVADIDGGTTDIVVQEWISETPDDYRVKEVAYSTSADLMGTFLYLQFKKCLISKIQCLSVFLERRSAFLLELFKRWEEIMRSFGDLVTIGESFEIQLPSKLAAEWKEFDEKHGNAPRTSYSELQLTHADIKAIFDPVVEQNLNLIADQLSRTSNVRVIFVVGELAGSPYLLTKIKEKFLVTVEKVISPVKPGSAVCEGAVMLALDRVS